jgi:hypothetical protein
MIKFIAPRPVFGVSHDGRELMLIGGGRNIPLLIDQLKINKNAPIVDIGIITSIAYATKRDNVKESYLHDFLPASRPSLAYKNGELLFLGGRYIFLDSGINDR